MNRDVIICRHCGMKKHRIFVPSIDGLNVRTLNHEDDIAKCCTRPYYEWNLLKR